METCTGKGWENRTREMVDENGDRWFEAYSGGGRHFENWLAQCRELGEVRVEEVPAKGLACFAGAGEKLFRIWVKMKKQPEGPVDKAGRGC